MGNIKEVIDAGKVNAKGVGMIGHAGKVNDIGKGTDRKLHGLV